MGGENDSSFISLVKESKLLTFSYLNESDLESTLTSLDQEHDNYLHIVTMGPMTNVSDTIGQKTKNLFWIIASSISSGPFSVKV